MLSVNNASTTTGAMVGERLHTDSHLYAPKRELLLQKFL